MENKQQIIAIDFDGVIHDHKNPVEGRRMGGPIEGAQKAIKILKLQRNFKIVIFSVWGGTLQGQSTIGEWMKFYSIPYDEITNIKPNALAYIDDKGIRYENWSQVLDLIKSL